MKQPIRFFSIGLFIASILLYGFYFLFNDNETDHTDIAVEDLITEIESKGYRVITEADYVAFSLSQEQNDDEADNEEKDNTDKDKDDDKEKDTDTEKDDSKEAEKENNNDDEVDEKEDEEEDITPEDVVKHTFTTEAGVVSQDIGNILLENNIIDDRQEFLDYLNDNDYSAYIQLGTFTVSSDMSYKEIAEIITTYPGN